MGHDYSSVLIEKPGTKATASVYCSTITLSGAAIETDKFACVYVQYVPVCAAVFSFLFFSR